MSDWASPLLPRNQTRLEAALTTASAERIVPEVISILWDANQCAVSALPWLAWALSVDEWDDAWPEEYKRKAITGSIAWHRKKGTPWAVKQALSAIGYPDSEIIEYSGYRQQWEDAGGRVLDGDWLVDGSIALSPPAGGDIRHLALNHWAEYAIRLNVGEGAWSRDQQRAIRRMAETYAPARSHLKKLLTRASLSFDAGIRLTGSRQRIHTRFDRCKRLTAHRWKTLDGCWLLDDGHADSVLDGGWTLGGARYLAGVIPVGQPIDSGFATFAARGRSRFALPAAGGDRVTAPAALVPTPRLDGSYQLDGRHLEGGWTLDGSASLDYPIFSTLGLRRLDGTWHLGRVPGQAGVWFSAVATIRRGGVLTREVL